VFTEEGYTNKEREKARHKRNKTRDKQSRQSKSKSERESTNGSKLPLMETPNWGKSGLPITINISL
jgi:hypothetical protein